MNIKALVIGLVLILMNIGVLKASEQKLSIFSRYIVYFYPNTEELNLEQLKSSFNHFTIVDELPTSSSDFLLSFSIIKDFKETYPVPDLSYLSYFARGIDKQQAERIQASNLAVIIDITYPEEKSIDGLKIVAEATYNFSESTGGLIWDSATRELFTPKSWKEIRIDTWVGKMAVIEDQTIIHAYRNNQGVRAITLGMEKLGLPDIVVNDFSWSLNGQMGHLINLVAQSIAEGVVPNQDSILEININALQETEFKKTFLSILKDGAEHQVNIQVGKGVWEEGDPENFIIELLFDNHPGQSISEKQEYLLSKLFGREDNVSYVNHNLLLEEVSNRAKLKLDGLKKDFNNGLDPGEFIQVKAPFKTPDEGTEWMWVEVSSWNGGEIKGFLKNEPYHVIGLSAGSEVVVNQEDVFDYIRTFPDGTSEGNETSEIIRSIQN